MKGIVIVYILISLGVLGMTADEYWEKLEKSANKKFGGFDIEVELEFNVDEDSENGELGFRMPIYSKKDKIDRDDKRRAFLDKGAELIEKYENCVGNIKLIKKKMEYIKLIMEDKGLEGVEVYFEVEEELLKAESEKRMVEKKLMVMIE